MMRMRMLLTLEELSRGEIDRFQLDITGHWYRQRTYLWLYEKFTC